jgi:branched-chain amino acid transport system substrate-binding protein
MAPWYWDTNDENRNFAERFSAQMSNGAYPNDHQAGIYSAVTHYLKSVEALEGKSADGAAVVAQMKALPTNDPLYGEGMIRQDGRKVHPLYLWRAKAPGESKSHWDLLEQVSMIPADQAFRPLAEGGCSLVQ